MKRANQLQPLSRQHHLGLNLSRHGKECTDEPTEINKHWLNITGYLKDMEHHFRVEDNLIVDALLPYRDTDPDVRAALATLDEQHKSLHALMESGERSLDSQSDQLTVTQVRELSALLYEHIRFEERELFPLVERCLTEEELDGVYDASPDSIKRPDENR